MKNFQLISTLFFLFTTNLHIHSQKKELSPWTIGAGISNYVISGDLKSKKINFGTYIYADRMLSPMFGFELKLFQNKTSGNSQKLLEIYTDLYTQQNINNLYFNGNTKGAEFNLITNLNGLNFKGHNLQKLKLGMLLGVGYQLYKSNLYNNTTNELLLEFPIEGSSTKSIYYKSAIQIKYNLSKRFDVELRQSININSEDNLDATVSNKQKTEIFYTTSIGIVYKLFKNKIIKKTNDLTVEKYINKIFKDSDNDGVIDKFDKEINTEKDALVYSDGVTIDSDKDNVPDHKDKCPLIFGTNENGCTKTIETINKIKTTPKLKNGTEKNLATNNKQQTTVIKEKNLATNNKQQTTIIKEKNLATNNKQQTTIIKGNQDPEYIKEKKLIDAIIANAKIKKEKKNNNTISIQKNETDIVKRYKSNPNFYKVKELNKKNIYYNIFELDNSVNLEDISTSPIYIGCENKPTEFDKKNCLYTNINNFSIYNFNKNNITSKLPKGLNTIRALIVIDDLGKAKILKTIGNWDKDVINEVKRVIDSLPLFKPGTLNNIPTPVKISIKIPFQIEP